VNSVFNEKDVEKICILNQVKQHNLTQKEAALLLDLSVRQIRRLLVRLAKQGLEGIKSRNKGGNRTLSPEFKQQVLDVVKQKYPNFGPTFAAEKLAAIEKLQISHETLRKWMIEAGLWKGKSRKAPRIHQSRSRRARFGELVQIDGSPHDWFEGRAPTCCLLVFVDDATSKIVIARFEAAETTAGYMACIQESVKKYGRPVSYYSDRHAIFKTARPNSENEDFEETQLHRALNDLGIELICANSPQAKGRVERANQTLQDRLVKELRLRGINTMEEANAYLPEFLEEYNRKFAVPAASNDDANRPLYHNKEQLRQIFSVQTTRRVSKNLEFSHKNIVYQLISKGGGYNLRNAKVTVCEHLDAEVSVIYHEKSLQYKTMRKTRLGPQIADAKEINTILDCMIQKSCQTRVERIIPNLENSLTEESLRSVA
jgi:transposase